MGDITAAVCTAIVLGEIHLTMVTFTSVRMLITMLTFLL
jgi:hypothetical protein